MHSREFCLVPSISDCSVLILLADTQLQCLLRGLQGSPVRSPPARFFSSTLTYVINLAALFFCAEIFNRSCHSDPEQKSLGYNPDIELSVVRIVFEKTSSENGSESTRGCGSKMGKET